MGEPLEYCGELASECGFDLSIRTVKLWADSAVPAGSVTGPELPPAGVASAPTSTAGPPPWLAKTSTFAEPPVVPAEGLGSDSEYFTLKLPVLVYAGESVICELGGCVSSATVL